MENNGWFAQIISIDVLSILRERASERNCSHSRDFFAHMRAVYDTMNACIKCRLNLAGTNTCQLLLVSVVVSHSLRSSHFGWFKTVLCFWSFSIFHGSLARLRAAWLPACPRQSSFVRWCSSVLNLFPLVPFRIHAKRILSTPGAFRPSAFRSAHFHRAIFIDSVKLFIRHDLCYFVPS